MEQNAIWSDFDRISKSYNSISEAKPKSSENPSCSIF